MTESSTAERAEQAVSTASDHTREVAHEARDQARTVVADVRGHAQDLLATFRSQLREHTGDQTERAAGGLRTMADQLSALAVGDPSAAGPWAGYLQEGRERLSDLAGRLEGGPDAVLDDVRNFARRQPWMFLAAAGVVGFAAGRIVRATTTDTGNEPDRSASLQQATVPVGRNTSYWPNGATAPDPVAPYPGMAGTP
jgi:ElaB/YqjD/DUF883 family membrane-anchored ribosome-binding protein